MPTWWVTGATGFLGRHVLSQLSRLRFENQNAGDSGNFRIVALCRRRPPQSDGGEPAVGVQVDLTDVDAIQCLAMGDAPDYVIHCAGKTPPGTEEELRRANHDATSNLLTVLRSLGRPARLVVAGSAAELGPVPTEELPVGEDYLCQPADTYGHIKLRTTQLVLAEPPPLEPIVVRIFNPIGPGLSSSQAFGRFARELLQPGPEPLTIRVGNLETCRDFVDVRDVASAMIDVALSGVPRGLYHVGTGKSHRIGDGLNELIRLSGLAVRIEHDLALGRPGGPSDSRADFRKLRNATGWEPKISWTKSLADLWEAARNQALKVSGTKPPSLL